MTDKLKYIFKFYLDEDQDVDFRVLRLAGAYTLMTMLLAVPCFIIAGYDRTVFYITLLGILMMFTTEGVFFLSKDVKLTSIVFCYVINIILLPLYYIYGGGLYGGIEFIFICGLVDGLVLLDSYIKAASEVLFFIWYAIVMIYVSMHPELTRNIPSGSVAIFSITMCMIFSMAIIIIVMEYERYLLRVKQSNVEEAVRLSLSSAETKSRFLTNVSHELRTPMNAVLGMSEIIQNDDSSGKLTEEISIINENARDLLSTINSILDSSRLESGKLRLSYDQFEFDKLMRDIIKEAAIRAEEKGIDLFVSIDPDSPNILYGDHIQIEMLLQDLLHDAINSVSDGRVIFKISGAFTEDHSKARYDVEISDTGDGISDEDMQTIYSSFETYDSRQDSRIKRLGLKYSVFKGILKLMNGDFKIESLEHIGTRISVSFETYCIENVVLADRKYTTGKKVLFYAYGERGIRYIEDAMSMFKLIVDVTYMPDDFVKMYSKGDYDYILISDQGYIDISDHLTDETKSNTFIITDRMCSPADFNGRYIIRRPVSALNLADIFFERWEEMDYEGAEQIEAFIANEANVLVVDDNNVNLKVADSMLAKYQMNVKLCESGFVAIEMMKEQSYDLVLMDQMMPGMDGYEALRLIRGNMAIRGSGGIPIICMTADSGGDAREKALKAGFNEYLMKPVKEKDLERILTTFIPNEKIKKV
ncbi:MAG: response regulator [Lachnospiraceae bacterium]|nr:response regulator [Lachnospiraceae bacterium]